MARMRISEALSLLRGIIPDEDAVLIFDGVHRWDLENLIEAVKGSDLSDLDDEVYDLAVNDGGIYWIRPDGLVEDTPTFRVISKPILWELLEEGTVIARLEQERTDYEVNGRGYVLEDIIPEEHTDAAQSGEWCEEGFVYTYAGKVYTVRRRE